jgi:hypothetical protein
MSNREQLASEESALDKAWKDLMAAYARLSALVEEGGGKVTMDLKVKAAKQGKK